MKITLVASHRAELAPWLIGYVGGEITGGEAPARRVIPARPNCFIQIILDGSHAMRDIEQDTRFDAPTAGLFGPLTHYRFDMEIGSALRTFSARLQPAAALQLFGVDPGALVDTFLPLDLPAGLLEELRAAPSWQAMVAPVDTWLGELAKGKRGTDAMTRAANHLRDVRGAVSVQQLADEAGLSLRQFQDRKSVV